MYYKPQSSTLVTYKIILQVHSLIKNKLSTYKLNRETKSHNYRIYVSIRKCNLTEISISVLSARDSSCPRICPPGGLGDPVCGTDGFIYPNICEMRKKTCGKGVNLASDPNACQRSSGSRCEHRCNTDKDPVCGTDGRTYLNR